MIKPIEASQLNSVNFLRDGSWKQGVLDACNLVNEMYSSSSTHPYLIGDCILAKLNLLKKKPRKNPSFNKEKVVKTR